MFIHEMSEFQCRKILEQSNFGRLACAQNDQPYVVPIYFAFDGNHIYGFTTPGQKVEWMRTNPRVCLEVDEREARNQWTSIVVFGRYEELPDQPEFSAARAEAHDLLETQAMWWEPAYVATEDSEIPHSFTPIFYRLHIDRMTGRQASPDQEETIPEAVQVSSKEQNWFGKILTRIRGKV